ncbi:MAG TPA: hypothetical protein PKN48_00740 [Bacteroidales bacterium]|nr:hypothetical protein [Bacteroidales bacterium]
MANNLDLDVLGKNISDEFVRNGIPMTTSLTKVASENGLNKHQISRVAEVANVEAYLTLIKTASNKYIEFPVADPLAVSAELSKTADAYDTSDYEKCPESSTSAESLFAAYEELNKTASIWSSPIVHDGTTYQIKLTNEALDIALEKVATNVKIQKLKELSLIKEADGRASFNYKGKNWNLVINDKTVEILKSASFTDSKFKKLASLGLVIDSHDYIPTQESDFRKVAQVREGEIKNLRNNLQEQSSALLGDIGDLYYFVKQASLSGELPKNVVGIIKVASANVYDLVAEPVLSKLQSEAPHLDYDSSSEKLVNSESELFKLARKIESKVETIETIKNNLGDLERKYAEFTKLKRLPDMITKTAMSQISATPVVAAFVAGGLMGHYVGKNKGKYEQGQVLQKALLKNNVDKLGV